MQACIRWRRNEGRHRDNLSTIRLASKRIVHRRIPAAFTALSLVLRHASPASGWLRFAGVVDRKELDSVTAAMFALSPPARAREDSIKVMWSESKPVLHLALALYQQFHGPGQVDILDLLKRPEWVRGALDYANLLLKILIATPSVRFAPSAAIVLLAA